MFEINYISDGGSVTLGGGDNPMFNVTSLSGFDFPKREYTTVTFAGENGITTIGKKDSARTLTIAGDLCGDKDDIIRACKAFYYDGELVCIFGDVRRKIQCKCTTLDDFTRYAHSGISSFAVQFTADYPYFTDIYQTITPIYSCKNLVTDSFSLPCVFTERLIMADIYNHGDKYVYPILELKNIGTASESVGNIIITNNTTGAKLSLAGYSMSAYEVISVDLATRQINSSACGNITNYISDDTDMSKFYLDMGKNNLSLFSSINQNINVGIIYSPEYIGAVR